MNFELKPKFFTGKAIFSLEFIICRPEGNLCILAASPYCFPFGRPKYIKEPYWLDFMFA